VAGRIILVDPNESKQDRFTRHLEDKGLPKELLPIRQETITLI
jgi:hypothetical protein